MKTNLLLLPALFLCVTAAVASKTAAGEVLPGGRGNQPARADEGSSPGKTPFRVAFSRSMFTEINENDAKAAVKVWARTLAQERNIPVEVEAEVLPDAEAIIEAMRNNHIAGASVVTDEYWRMSQQIPFSHLIYSVRERQITEEYVLLVRRDQSLERVEDLRGRSVIFFQNPRASLAPIWLESLLLQRNLGLSVQFCGSITYATKTTRVILPVYFQQVDACVATRKGFETMGELNPQIGRQLKIIATSSALVPTVFCIQESYQPSFLDVLLQEIQKTDTTPAGQQVLAVFQCDDLAEHPASALDTSLELLKNHARQAPAPAGLSPAIRTGPNEKPGIVP